MIAVDLARGMLVADRERRPPAIVGDAVALPFASGSFRCRACAVLPQPPRRAERGRGRGRGGALPGGVLLASTYAADDDHVVKAAVDQALSEAGWAAPGWYGEVKAAMTSWGTVDAAAAAFERGRMAPVLVERR